MECLNLRPFCYKKQAQDAPKTPQDARGCLKRCLKPPQDTPKTPQDAPRTPPKTPQDVPKTPQRQGPSSQDAPRRPQAAPRHPQGWILEDFWSIFEWFLDHFSLIFETFWQRFCIDFWRDLLWVRHGFQRIHMASRNAQARWRDRSSAALWIKIREKSLSKMVLSYGYVL